MLAAQGRVIFIFGYQDPFPVVIGVRNITSEASKVCHEHLSNFEDGLSSRMQINFVGLRFVLEERPGFSHRRKLALFNQIRDSKR